MKENETREEEMKSRKKDMTILYASTALGCGLAMFTGTLLYLGHLQSKEKQRIRLGEAQQRAYQEMTLDPTYAPLRDAQPKDYRERTKLELEFERDPRLKELQEMFDVELEGRINKLMKEK